ncbi:DUF6986 family protein [Rhodococcus triatomae]|uniref:DUF6986 family protein n=1 Tax=Rhodococcus triatomae TaxID=300028 RepID=UPI0009342CFC
MPVIPLDRIDSLLAPVDRDLDRRYPGDDPEGQPLHTVYVSAADASTHTPIAWGAHALDILDRHVGTLHDLVGERVVEDVRAALSTRPIQDLRVDFEDGYGWRDDSVEDAHAVAAGRALAALAGDPSGPDVVGIRPKGLAPHERRRAIRTLELVLDAAGGVPAGFVFTVPKLRAAEQVVAVVAICEELERAHELTPGSLRFELQIESPQAVIDADGTATVARALHSAEGRCTGLHYGTYDYSAACGIASRYQSLDHPVADHAKAVMLAAAAQTGVWVCDGSTQVVPTGSDAHVDAALRRHFGLVTRSLERGYYQGWDMHAGHLVTRYAATFAFYRSALEPAAERLQAYLDRVGGDVVDEPATAQALATVVLRGLAAGAFEEDTVLGLGGGCTIETLRALVARTVSPGSPLP